jgi:hypothetical protein
MTSEDKPEEEEEVGVGGAGDGILGGGDAGRAGAYLLWLPWWTRITGCI